MKTRSASRSPGWEAWVVSRSPDWAAEDSEDRYFDSRVSVTEYLGVVRAVALKMAGSGDDIEELVQEGSIALLEAAEGFDPSTGWPFARFVRPLIKDAMLRWIAERFAASFAIPFDPVVSKRIARVWTRLRARLHRAPTTEELAREFRRTSRDLALSPGQGVAILSLDSPVVGHAPSHTHSRWVAPPTLRDLLHEIESGRIDEGELEQIVDLALMILTPRQADILVALFGLTGDPAATVAEAARLVHVSPETARQLRQKAFAVLRTRELKNLLRTINEAHHQDVPGVINAVSPGGFATRAIKRPQAPRRQPSAQSGPRVHAAAGASPHQRPRTASDANAAEQWATLTWTKVCSVCGRTGESGFKRVAGTTICRNRRQCDQHRLRI